MRLSEIAEHVVDNNPNCCVRFEVIRDCRTEPYEESLIEPLLYARENGYVRMRYSRRYIRSD